jgi:uncharacterized cupin superfamily protein
LKCIVTAIPERISLEPSPFPEEWVMDGNPEACAKQIASSEDGRMRVIVWSCTEGRFEWHYDVDEVAQLLSGEAFVTDHQGVERRLTPGDTVFFPAGTKSVWRVTKAVRKVAVCRGVMPKVISFGLRACGNIVRRARILLTRQQSGKGGGGLLPLAYLFLELTTTLLGELTI